MSITNEAQALKRIIPLSVLPQEKLKLLAFECQLLHFRSGAIILQQGVVQNEFYAVVEGSVEYFGTTDGVFSKKCAFFIPLGLVNKGINILYRTRKQIPYHKFGISLFYRIFIVQTI